jgi:phosphatidate cytidylyltransferase
LALAAVFWLPAGGFFLVIVALLEVAVAEYVQLGRHWAPHGPLRALLVLVPLAALGSSLDLLPAAFTDTTGTSALAVATLVAIGSGILVLLLRTPVEEGLQALGLLAFGVVYLALPITSLSRLQRYDPWVLFLLLVIVWAGDTAAFYCGRQWGRRKLAPRISPNKTWEGAVANFVVALIVAAAWSSWRLGELRGSVLLVAALVSVAAQLGDLVESLIKRGAGVKDSGQLLPGHGGMLDRLDALLFAAPVMLLLGLLGTGKLKP